MCAWREWFANVCDTQCGDHCRIPAYGYPRGPSIRDGQRPCMVVPLARAIGIGHAGNVIRCLAAVAPITTLRAGGRLRLSAGWLYSNLDAAQERRSAATNIMAEARMQVATLKQADAPVVNLHACGDVPNVARSQTQLARGLEAFLRGGVRDEHKLH